MHTLMPEHTAESRAFKARLLDALGHADTSINSIWDSTTLDDTAAAVAGKIITGGSGVDGSVLFRMANARVKTNPLLQRRDGRHVGALPVGGPSAPKAPKMRELRLRRSLYGSGGSVTFASLSAHSREEGVGEEDGGAASNTAKGTREAGASTGRGVKVIDQASRRRRRRSLVGIMSTVSFKPAPPGMNVSRDVRTLRLSVAAHSMEGWLRKFAMSGVGRPRRRFFVLRGNLLATYARDPRIFTKLTPKKIIELTADSKVALLNSRLALTSPQGVLRLSSLGSVSSGGGGTLEEWRNVLASVISALVSVQGTSIDTDHTPLGDAKYFPPMSALAQSDKACSLNPIDADLGVSPPGGRVLGGEVERDPVVNEERGAIEVSGATTSEISSGGGGGDREGEVERDPVADDERGAIEVSGATTSEISSGGGGGEHEGEVERDPVADEERDVSCGDGNLREAEGVDNSGLVNAIRLRMNYDAGSGPDDCMDESIAADMTLKDVTGGVHNHIDGVITKESVCVDVMNGSTTPSLKDMASDGLVDSIAHSIGSDVTLPSLPSPSISAQTPLNAGNSLLDCVVSALDDASASSHLDVKRGNTLVQTQGGAWGRVRMKLMTAMRFKLLMRQMRARKHVDEEWYYLDCNGGVQGPFSREDMARWRDVGFFGADQLIHSSSEGDAWTRMEETTVRWCCVMERVMHVFNLMVLLCVAVNECI